MPCVAVVLISNIVDTDWIFYFIADNINLSTLIFLSVNGIVVWIFVDLVFEEFSVVVAPSSHVVSYRTLRELQIS